MDYPALLGNETPETRDLTLILVFLDFLYTPPLPTLECVRDEVKY